MDNQPQEPVADEETLTPIPREVGQSITMSFPDAIREIGKGKRVRRISWPDSDYGVLQDGWLSIFTNGKLHVWKVSDGDFEGQDWIVIVAIN